MGLIMMARVWIATDQDYIMNAISECYMVMMSADRIDHGVVYIASIAMLKIWMT